MKNILIIAGSAITCKCIITTLAFLFSVLFARAQADNNLKFKAHWISAPEKKSLPNTWLACCKKVNIDNLPARAIAKIAADSKYWLWINGSMVVFEGGLKRIPDPYNTYYDTVDIASKLRVGENSIAILVWYFGKEGFSHKSSGRAGLIFDCQAQGLEIISNNTWKCFKLACYRTAARPLPNIRLPESSILYDARREVTGWNLSGFDSGNVYNAVEAGTAGSSPWNGLILRPVPLWKDLGLKKYVHQRISSSRAADTIICTLPYNTQFTPYFEVESNAGKRITICTDNYLYYNAGVGQIRGEYITKSGKQHYESLGWLNGHFVYYIIPKGIRVYDLMYRETGYNTHFAGSFNCSDTLLNKYWKKAQRTLYLNMRDSYMDCPDRERAQWAGDAALSSGAAFYALSNSSHALTKKWLYEFFGWQRPDSSLYAPVPAGISARELPVQSAAAVGYYGLWNYYLHTGDKQTIADLYDGAKRYLESWKKDEKGTVRFREVGWQWGDWGNNQDMLILYDAWYYLGIKGLYNMAKMLGKRGDEIRYAAFMDTFKSSFNRQFWNGTAYKNPRYKGATDDRAQALAVVAGIAEKDKYPFLLKVFQSEEHASPYMERYVFEAMFKMRCEHEAIARFKKRFAPMVNHPGFTTLFEGWNLGADAYGNGTVNHAWSGGGLTVLSQYVCGIAPIDPGYKTFQIAPQPGPVLNASACVSTVAGTISSSFVNSPDSFILKVDIPANTAAMVVIPGHESAKVTLNGIIIWENGSPVDNAYAEFIENINHAVKFRVQPGRWEFKACR